MEDQQDLVSNTSSNDDSQEMESSDDDEREEESGSLHNVFNRYFETLREIYRRVTDKDLPEASSFKEETSLSVKGKQTTVKSSAPFEQLKTSREGEWRGIYVVKDNFLRYFLYVNRGESPDVINTFSLRVVKPSDSSRSAWAEIKLSTMPDFIAEKAFADPSGMNKKKNVRKFGDRGMRKMNEDEDNDVDVTANANEPNERSETDEVEED